MLLPLLDFLPFLDPPKCYVSFHPQTTFICHHPLTLLLCLQEEWSWASMQADRDSDTGSTVSKTKGRKWSTGIRSHSKEPRAVTNRTRFTRHSCIRTHTHKHTHTHIGGKREADIRLTEDATEPGQRWSKREHHRERQQRGKTDGKKFKTCCLLCFKAQEDNPSVFFR